jgi:hypothetical protein
MEKIINDILIAGNVPDAWTVGIIDPIYKDKDSKDPSNYRPIS